MKEVPHVHCLLREYAQLRGYRCRGHYIYKEAEAAIVLVGWNSSWLQLVQFDAGLFPLGTPKSRLNSLWIGLPYQVGCLLWAGTPSYTAVHRVADAATPVDEATELFWSLVAPDIDQFATFAESREDLYRALQFGYYQLPELDHRQGFQTSLNAWTQFGFVEPAAVTEARQRVSRG